MQPKPLPKPFTITNGVNDMKNLKYFSAAWCGPCKTFKPIIEEISSEGHSVQFIDIDTSSDLAPSYYFLLNLKVGFCDPVLVRETLSKWSSRLDVFLLKG